MCSATENPWITRRISVNATKRTNAVKAGAATAIPTADRTAVTAAVRTVLNAAKIRIKTTGILPRRTIRSGNSAARRTAQTVQTILLFRISTAEAEFKEKKRTGNKAAERHVFRAVISAANTETAEETRGENKKEKYVFIAEKRFTAVVFRAIIEI